MLLDATCNETGNLALDSWDTTFPKSNSKIVNPCWNMLILDNRWRRAWLYGKNEANDATSRDSGVTVVHSLDHRSYLLNWLKTGSLK